MYQGVDRGVRPKMIRVIASCALSALILATCQFTVGQVQSATVSSAPTVPGSTRVGHSAGIQRPGQHQQSQKSKIDKRVEILTKQLALNDVQRFDLRKILESGQAEAKRLWDDQQISPMDRMIKMRALREGAQKQFHAILSDEQKKKYDEYLQREMRANSVAPSSSPSPVSSPSPESSKTGH